MNIHDASEFCDISHGQGVKLLRDSGLYAKYEKLEKTRNEKPKKKKPNRYLLKTAEDIAQERAELKIAQEIDRLIQIKPLRYVMSDMCMSENEIRKLSSRFGVKLGPDRLKKELNPSVWLKPKWQPMSSVAKEDLLVLKDLESSPKMTVSKRYNREPKDITRLLDRLGLSTEEIKTQAARRYQHLAEILNESITSKGLASTARIFGFNATQIKYILKAADLSNPAVKGTVHEESNAHKPELAEPTRKNENPSKRNDLECSLSEPKSVGDKAMREKIILLGANNGAVKISSRLGIPANLVEDVLAQRA